MTRGRRGDKTYTGFNGASTDRLRELDKLRQPASGIDGRVAPPSQEALQAFIASQTCPWCGAGPFKMLATHTHSAHGVSAAEFRELAGLTRHAPLCSPDHSAHQAARLAGQALPPVAYERTGGRHVYSEAGKAAQRVKAGRVTDDDRRRAARASGDKQLAANADKHAEILRRYAEGEPVMAIAKNVGMTRGTVQRTLVREGVWVDGRARRWKD